MFHPNIKINIVFTYRNNINQIYFGVLNALAFLFEPNIREENLR